MDYSNYPLPDICGSEKEIQAAIEAQRDKPVFLHENTVHFSAIRAACAVALHMHQPLIPAGGDDMRTAALISNLAFMMKDPGSDNHYNANIFRHCYRRMGDIIRQLVDEGEEPRIMLEYSGTLLHGLKFMGADDVFEALEAITCDPRYRRTVEWLGCPWGHAVAPSTPVQDFRLHVRAWQHHFAALFGIEALGRVRGFSPSEMALPNHPDVAFEFVKTLKECGYTWVLVQEHTVEQPQDGRGPERRHFPHLLVCRHSNGQSQSIIAFIKTQGSDTKLVGQMQPWFEAKGLQRINVAGREVPQVVTQIADGENGGVMMNEFPSKYIEVAKLASESEYPLLCGTEYLEHLFASGLTENDLPQLQPLFQKRIWDRMKPGDGTDKLNQVIEELRKEDNRFHMEGGSWTNNISWVRGYDNLLGPMERVSSLFHEKLIKPGISTKEPRFRNALFHLLSSQTSCYRYWGQGMWTDYGREICRRVEEVLG